MGVEKVSGHKGFMCSNNVAKRQPQPVQRVALNTQQTWATSLLNEKKMLANVAHCSKRIIQQSVQLTQHGKVSGVGARLIRLESPSNLS